MNSRCEMRLHIQCYSTLYQLKRVLTAECNEDSGMHASHDHDIDIERFISCNGCSAYNALMRLQEEDLLTVVKVKFLLATP